MALFAVTPVDEVTVQDIAGAVDMTPAAVYYHFASKEQILVEGMQRFGRAFVDEIRAHLPERRDEAGIRALLGHLLAWTNRHRSDATVYFVSSIGLNLMVEALRREKRLEMVEAFREAVQSTRGPTSTAEAGVIAVGLVSLLETSLASMLNQDTAFRSLGQRRFAQTVMKLGDGLAGVGPAESPG